MFFRKKPKKLDPKVRFQHKQFTGKLKAASSYKRKAQAIPESPLDKFFLLVGLRSKFSKISFAFLLMLLFYLVYIPNFLTLKSIEVTGLSEQQKQLLTDAIWKEIDHTFFVYPQKNLLFLQSQIVTKVAATIPTIKQVASVRRDYGSQTLYIDAESKYERFLVATPEKVYDVYTDGVLARQSNLNIEQWVENQNISMLKLQLHSPIQTKDYDLVFDSSLLGFLNNLSEQLKGIPNLQISYYQFREPVKIETPVVPLENGQELNLDESIRQETTEIETSKEMEEIKNLQLPIFSSEVQVVVRNNQNPSSKYRVIFDTTHDPLEAINNLKLLLANITPDRYGQLSYIDMRVAEKAFICLSNSPCDK